MTAVQSNMYQNFLDPKLVFKHFPKRSVRWLVIIMQKVQNKLKRSYSLRKVYVKKLNFFPDIKIFKHYENI